MGKHIESVEEKIKKIDEEIENLNDACASEMAEVLGGVTGRILSYAKQEKVDRIIEKYICQNNNIPIYCEATSKPEGWDELWVPTSMLSRYVTWGYTE